MELGRHAFLMCFRRSSWMRFRRMFRKAMWRWSLGRRSCKTFRTPLAARPSRTSICHWLDRRSSATTAVRSSHSRNDSSSNFPSSICFCQRCVSRVRACRSRYRNTSGARRCIRERSTNAGSTRPGGAWTTPPFRPLVLFPPPEVDPARAACRAEECMKRKMANRKTSSFAWANSRFFVKAASSGRCCLSEKMTTSWTALMTSWNLSIFGIFDFCLSGRFALGRW
mmetsp:Transcript_3320/g.10949  ORF Transcript_3320/g.10949 Transcript_3320/m.10949 type:complete len:225 (+) Transcript_3320:253-927(+)